MSAECMQSVSLIFGSCQLFNSCISPQTLTPGLQVRVHSVLKQQKTRDSSHVVMETEMQEKDHLEKMNKQLKTKIQEGRSVVQKFGTILHHKGDTG